MRGVGRSVERLELARRIGAIDEFELEGRDALSDRDLVVLATPIEHILATLGALGRLAPGAVVTDVGSTKRAIWARAREALSSGVAFVGGHPLAGAETAGVENAREDLFDGATWYLTPARGSTAGVLYERLHGLLRRFGAQPQAIDADLHDRLLACVSHLPHVLANLLAAQAESMIGEITQSTSSQAANRYRP